MTPIEGGSGRLVADQSIATDIPGIQNVWVQSVGCGTAAVHFGA
jgi:hypothetical protein